MKMVQTIRFLCHHCRWTLLLTAGMAVLLIYKMQGSLQDLPKSTTSDSGLKVVEKDPRESVFKLRSQHLINTCIHQGHTPPTDVYHSKILKRMVFETRHKIVYCPIEKVASTFWKRTLTAIGSEGKFTSPYDVKQSSKYKVNTFRQLISTNHFHATKKQLRNATSLIVVRDPYAKLFSGYTDKLFHPNYLFWRLTGIPIKQIIRKYSNPNSNLICGNDVTFAEFIKYVIHAHEQDMHINSHFTGITSHCYPCKTKYDYISKVETLKEDVYYIINDWRERFNVNIQFNDFHRDTAMNIARTHINISFETMRKFAEKCKIASFNFLLRTWRFLQISGYIPKDISVPFKDGPEARLVTANDFISAIESVLARNISWTEVKKQRKEALIQAYQTISKDDMEKLREIVKDDCLYFQYDDRPKHLFDKNSTAPVDFNYFDSF